MSLAAVDTSSARTYYRVSLEYCLHVHQIRHLPELRHFLGRHRPVRARRRIRSHPVDNLDRVVRHLHLVLLHHSASTEDLEAGKPENCLELPLPGRVDML